MHHIYGKMTQYPQTFCLCRCEFQQSDTLSVHAYQFWKLKPPEPIHPTHVHAHRFWNLEKQPITCMKRLE